MAVAPAKNGSVEVIKSPNDKKQYRYIILPNELEALLIHDPSMIDGAEDADGTSAMDEDGSQHGSDNASEHSSSGAASSQAGSADGGAKAAPKRAAAAMAVGTGSFRDPPDMQGLSHYLEHMLFMGSSEFPGEDDYDDYLVRNAGASNAFTEAEFTNYHFNVKPSALEGALRRFSAFFKSPLCLESALEREVKAVDSEFTGVSQDDQCRMLGLMSHTARDGHPFQKFMWGNKQSLWDEPQRAGIAIRDRILDYYQQHYSSSVMRLAVLGAQPLDDLEGLVRDLFSPVANKNTAPLDVKEFGYPFEGQASFCLVTAVHEGHSVSVTFQLPSLLRQYDCKADEYISHLVGHEGPGSLLSALKQRGWATDLCAGVDSDGLARNTAFYLFQVQMTLTAAGLDAGPGFGLAPVGLMFEYLRMLKREGPQSWVWGEIRSIHEMRFRFKQEHDAMETVTELASDMLTYSPEDVLQGGYLYRRWDPNLIQQLLSLMEPDAVGMRVDLQTSSYDDLLARAKGTFPDMTMEREKWFDLPFAVAALPQSITSPWCTPTPSSELQLPPRNPFIPTHFAMLADAQPNCATATCTLPETLAVSAPLISVPPGALLAPECVLDEPGLRVIHKLVTAYEAPRGIIIFRLTSPALHGDPCAHAHAQLLVDCWNDAVTELAYLADMASLSSHIALEGADGLEVVVSGFTDKLAPFTKAVYDAFVDMAAVPNWAAIKERRLQRARNDLLDVQKHANWLRLRLLMSANHDEAEVFAALQSAEEETVLGIKRDLLACCHLEALAEGNISSAEAVDICRYIRQRLGSGNQLANSRAVMASAELQAGVPYRIRAPGKNPDEMNSMVQVYVQLGEYSVNLKAKQELLDQVLQEPVYNVLRTQQQLGYSVHSTVTNTAGMLGYLVAVCSVKSPTEVEAAIETFLADFAETIASMTDDEFRGHVNSLVTLKLEACKNVSEAADVHWAPVWRQTYDFYDRYQVADELETVTREDLLQLYNSALAPGSKRRRKLAVHVVANQHDTHAPPLAQHHAEHQVEHRVVEVHDIDATKAKLQMTRQPIATDLRISKS